MGTRSLQPSITAATIKTETPLAVTLSLGERDDEELAAWRSLPFNEEHYRITEVGSRSLVGEAGYSVLERTWARPTLDVHGIPGGFIGAGAKTVIPAKALAKVSTTDSCWITIVRS